MVQTIGILGFFLSLLALFFASEVMRRASHRENELELSLFKLQSQLKQMESKMFHVEKLAAEIRYQRKRQAETLNALAQKGEDAHAAKPAASTSNSGTPERFTPSEYKDKKVG